MKISKSKAFTLAEILIAVGIIVLLASATLVGLSVNRNRQILIVGAEKIKATLQQAQEYAEHPRSQDYRPLYYAVRFTQTTDGFRATLTVVPDTNNDGNADLNVDNRPIFNEISRVNLRSATVRELGNPFMNIRISESVTGIYCPLLLHPPACPWGRLNLMGQPVWLGFRVGNPSQMVAYFPNERILTNPGELMEANAVFDFSDPDTNEAYANTMGINKYPAIIFTNYGAKIEVQQVD